MRVKRYGVVDIGTLKVKLQIVEKTASGDLKTIEQSNNLTCLGVRMEENGGRPKEEYLQQTIGELERCKQVIKKEKVDRVRVVSTHALREMGQVGKEVVELIKKKVGFQVEIISQQEEAELFYRAVLRDFKTDEDFTILDVGGGSVQILIGNRRKLKESFLLKTGTSTLWDRFTPGHGALDFPKRAEIGKMRNYVLQQLQPVPEKIRTPIVYGSSCIIDVFAGVRLPVQDYGGSPSHPKRASVAVMEKFLGGVWRIPYDTREEMFGSPTTKYMWGIDKAFLNVVELAKRIEAPYVIPSNANINQGLLLALVEA